MIKDKPTLKLKAKADCKNCHGSGVVYDSVPMPFGHGNCLMPSDCECCFEDLPDDVIKRIDDGEDYEILEASDEG